MAQRNLSFDQLMEIYKHIGEEERHFNSLEMEYRKLASHWLLVTLGAIGYVFTKKAELPIDAWILVIGMCIAASVGILIIWFLDMKVYHELLHAAFAQGVHLEKEYPEYLPPIRNNMVKSQLGGDIIKRVMLYYFFSVLILILIANISVWFFLTSHTYSFMVNLTSVLVIILLFKTMRNRSNRTFGNN